MDAYPHNAKVHFNWGTQLQEDEKWLEAAAEYEKAVKFSGGSYYMALCNLGFVYEKLKKPWVKLLSYPFFIVSTAVQTCENSV